MGKENGINAVINGTSYPIEFADNTLCGSLKKMLPFELTMSRSADHEYYAALPDTPETGNAVLTSKVKSGGVYYFKAWNALALNFRDMDISPYQVYEVGASEEIAEILENSDSSLKIRFE